MYIPPDRLTHTSLLTPVRKDLKIGVFNRYFHKY